MNYHAISGFLMNSHGIHQVLQNIILTKDIDDDSQIAIIAALKWLEPAYQGLGALEIAGELGAMSTLDLVDLARLVHPVVCSLKLEKWLEFPGDCHYLVQFAVPRGDAGRRMLLDCNAREISQADVLAMAASGHGVKKVTHWPGAFLPACG